MANGDGFNFQGLLSSPLFNIGTGLLAAGLGNPTSFGEGLAQGLSFGNRQQGRALQNEFVRERIRDATLARQAGERRQRAVGLLKDRIEGDDTQGPPSQSELLGLLVDIAPGATTQGLLGQILPQQQGATGFQRDFAFLVQQGIAQGLTEAQASDRALKTLKRGTTVNVGKEDKPLSVTDLSKVRFPDGSKPPIGTTMRQAAAAGGTVLSTDQQKALDAADKFQGVLGRLESLALGPEGVFTNIEPGLQNRFKAGFDLFVSSLDREKPNVAEFDSLAKGTVAPIIRQLGDSGALSDGDVQRALGLLPQIQGDFLLPDTREDAKRKLNTLREILERGEKKLRSNIGSRSGKVRERQAPQTPRVLDFNDLPG